MRAQHKLAVHKGQREVTVARPHFVWPPPASHDELEALSLQRNLDISIKGSSGPVLALEEAWKDFLGGSVKYAITFNSGTSALLAAYFALGIEEGDEVIVPAITYHAAVSCIYFLRATPVLVDVELESWCIDPQQIEAAITPRTKAITVVHQWGHPAEMREICRIAEKHGLYIIEDCSHAHCSKYYGQQVGTFGDIAVFSFQANKIVFAGEGGILVTNSSELHDRATLLGHYRDRSRDEIVDPFYQQFWVTGYGLKLRMSPYNAVTALYAVQALPTRIAQRKRCLEYFSQGLSDLTELVVPRPKQHIDMGAWYGFKPRYVSAKLHNISRARYIEALVAEGVEVSEPGSPAFTQLPLYTLKDDKMFRATRNKRVYTYGQFPVAEQLAAEGLSLPTFTNWPQDNAVIDQYVAAFHKVHYHAKELL